MEAVVFDLADSIIGKSSSLTLPETEPWLNVKDDVDDLRNTVSAIKANLLNAGERSATSTFTASLKKLKDALCDARNLLEELSSEIWRENMCARIQAVNKRLTSLESEFKIPFMAGTRLPGRFFVHKDEEQSVNDYSFQGRLTLQMIVDDITTASLEIYRSKMKTKKKIHETYLYEKKRQSWLDGLLYAEVKTPNLLIFMSNGSKKRNRKFVSDDSLRQERKGIRKQRQLRYRGESLTSQPQRKSKRKECPFKNFIKWGSAQEMEKFYEDRTERRINNNGKIKYWERKLEGMEMRRMETKASQFLDDVPIFTKIMETKPSQHILCYIDQFKKQWLQSDPLVIKQEIQEIDRKYKDAVLAEDEAKRRLLLVGEKIEELDRQRSEFYFAHRWSEKVTSTDDRVSMLTREKEVLSKLRDLENQLYDKDNNKVEYKDFLGLEQALKKTAWGKTPDYLQPIAIRIEKARGKATDVFHIPAQVPVCAAIKEMEEFPVEDLDWDTLKKWGATLNYAKKYGFQVGFADKLLKKNLLAYLVIQNLPNSTAKN
ncbi:hypothetical protein E1A91_A11G361200v1 [Gossypium mustelinum]|uniref:Disease resistance N-terminal domain-containing protein n=1 Tax=Gossypium mustelinum TaxID=34275 RepID=A0A5D2XFY0_GOSMU|nr:hypothetical protein E1A91_A11G361200v1 [Gossypium mustelinum]